jgi:hypothetical protein
MDQNASILLTWTKGKKSAGISLLDYRSLETFLTRGFRDGVIVRH